MIFGRLFLTSESFTQSEWNLGGYSKLVAWIALMWSTFAITVLSLPQVFGVTSQNFNYAPVMLVIIISLALGSWFFSAKYWFKGPGMKESTLTQEKSNATIVTLQ